MKARKVLNMSSSLSLKRALVTLSTGLLSYPYYASVWVRIPAWTCEKVASDLGLGGGFRRVLWFPPLLTTSHELATIGINVTKNKIPNPNPLLCFGCKIWVIKRKVEELFLSFLEIRRQKNSKTRSVNITN